MEKLRERLLRVPVLGTALRVNDHYRADAGNEFAGAIAFFGFLSLLPLLLLSLSIVAFVNSDPLEQARVVVRIARTVPGLGGTILPIIDSLVENRGTIGLIGLAGVILAGLRVVAASMIATSRVYGFDTSSFTGLQLRVRQVVSLVVLGLLAALGAAAGLSPGVDTAGALAFVLSVAGSVLSVGFDVLLFATAYKLLAVGEGPELGRLWPGALVAAVGWTGLKFFGATYVAGQIAKTNALYGAFGTTIALLLLLFLAARLYLYGAELNVVLWGKGAAAGVPPERDTSAPSDAPAGAPLPVGERVLAEHERREREAAERNARVAARRAAAAGEAVRAPAGAPSPAITPATRARVEAADAEDRGPTPVRKAAAFTIAVGAIGALYAAMRPDRRR